jgi:hypothetical protein
MAFRPVVLACIFVTSIGVFRAVARSSRDCGDCRPPQQSVASGIMTYKFDSSIQLGLRADFENRANEWNSAFQAANSNVRLIKNESSGSITISIDDTICGSAWAEARVQYQTLRLCSNTLAENNDFLQNTISHEWGHFAGFSHGTCPKSESVMTPVQPNEMSGATTSPGCADAAAVNDLYFRRDDDADGYSPSDSPADCNDNPNNNGAAFHPGASEDCYTSSDDRNCDGVTDYMGAYCQAVLGTPIIVDTAGDGIRLSNTEDGVEFDLRPDGVPEQLPWTLLGTDDGWLALDRNGNGTIDSGYELFGNFTLQQPSTSPNGFLALGEFDFPENGGNGDLWIDPEDRIYNDLRLWVDRNHDGISQPRELRLLSTVGLRRMSLDYAESRRVDSWGNWFRYRARVVDDRGHDLGRWAWDVYLAARPPRSKQKGAR